MKLIPNLQLPYVSTSLPDLEEARHKRFELRLNLRSAKYARQRERAALKNAKHDLRVATVNLELARRERDAFEESRRNSESDLAYALACGLDVNAEITSLIETTNGWWVHILDGTYTEGAYAGLLTRDGHVRPCRRLLDEDGTLPMNEADARQRLGPPIPLPTPS